MINILVPVVTVWRNGARHLLRWPVVVFICFSSTCLAHLADNTANSLDHQCFLQYEMFDLARFSVM